MHQTIISVEELKENFSNTDWVICYCRFDIHNPSFGREAYLEGHIHQAIYVDLDMDLSTKPDGTNGRHPLPSLVELLELIESLGITNQSQVVVYDDEGGGSAARLWWILRYLGHENVAVLDGGIQSWMTDGNDLTDIEDKKERGHFEADMQEDRLMSLDQLRRNLENMNFITRYARPREISGRRGTHRPDRWTHPGRRKPPLGGKPRRVRGL